MAPISVKTENCPHREHTSHPTIQDSYYLTAVNELCIYLPQSYSNPHTTQQRNPFRKQREVLGSTGINYLHCWIHPSLRIQEQNQNSSQYSSHSPEAY